MLKAYGFTQALDLEFSKWYNAALRVRSEMKIPDDALMPESQMTFGEGRLRTLRAQVKKACARFHGDRNGNN